MAFMQVRHLLSVMESLAPARGAESWDNTGLLLGAPDWSAERVLLAIDLTEHVLSEAVRRKSTAIIAYHPPFFEPIRALTHETAAGRMALRAAKESIAIVSPHTRLDSSEGGVNDWLAEAFGSGDRRALDPKAHLPRGEAFKIVTFCPAEAVERVRDSLASVGAGAIGAYRRCSFELSGHGTFEGGEGTRPVIGRAGRLERAAETRLEMVCAEASLALAVLTLRQVHPYEEPAYEIYRMEPRPERGFGAGRRIVLDQPLALSEIVEGLKRHLSVDGIAVAAPPPPARAPKRHQVIGLCAGAGGSLLQTAIAQGCDFFLTGEMRHHDVLAANAVGCTVALAGHTNTERGYLSVLRTRLQKAFASLAIPDAAAVPQMHIARRDRDPLVML